VKKGARLWQTRTAHTLAAFVRSSTDTASHEEMKITAVITVHRLARDGLASVCAAIRIARQQG
jgi:translation initiation factor 2 alpha subunit (eIF-2alpha)